MGKSSALPVLIMRKLSALVHLLFSLIRKRKLWLLHDKLPQEWRSNQPFLTQWWVMFRQWRCNRMGKRWRIKTWRRRKINGARGEVLWICVYEGTPTIFPLHVLWGFNSPSHNYPMFRVSSAETVNRMIFFCFQVITQNIMFFHLTCFISFFPLMHSTFYLQYSVKHTSHISLLLHITPESTSFFNKTLWWRMQFYLLLLFFFTASRLIRGFIRHYHLIFFTYSQIQKAKGNCAEKSITPY